MKMTSKLCINRIMKPGISVFQFIQLAKKIGATSIELRNDLANSNIIDNERVEEVNASLNNTNIDVLTINALQRFNDPFLFKSKKEELRSLMVEAAAIHCQMIILCPVCDPADDRSEEKQADDLVLSLKAYAPLFKEFNMVGLIEPLGFSICSIRYKKQAVDAIEASGFNDIYKLVHDTFHHYLADEREFFPEMTGLVHISGVLPGKSKDKITDEDRVFIDKNDIMNNKYQINQLIDLGCIAPLSFEPFSSQIQALAIEDLEIGIKESLKYIL